MVTIHYTYSRHNWGRGRRVEMKTRKHRKRRGRETKGGMEEMRKEEGWEGDRT